MIFPAQFVAGTTFKRSASPPCYRAEDGWALSAALRGPSAIDLTASVDAGVHLFLAGADATAEWGPGRYSYTVRAEKDGEVFEVESGAMEIRPDIAGQSAGVDGRTQAERTLEAIEAVIESRASLDQERYRINNRELYRTPIADLLLLRDKFRAEVQRERLRARGGAEFGRSVKVRL